MRKALVCLAGLVSACGGLQAALPHGLTERPPFKAFAGGKLPPSAPTFSGEWSAVAAFPNLTFLNPMGLLPFPGGTNLVVWEREGRIYHFPNERLTTERTLVLDISRQCQGWDDSGLMGIAFHPGFATNRYLFIYYNYVAPGTVRGSATARPPTATPNRDRLERHTLDEHGVAIPGSAAIFIDQISQTVWHNGGGMFFHPKDGFLYLTNGDDAQPANNQRIDYSLHSGVLRIDVDQRGGAISHPIPKQPRPAGSVTQNYFIPNDNPFVGQPGALEEFFAIGLRSPHRMTIDPLSGRIFIGDVGEGSWEELDLIEPHDPPGLNFQWNRFEGKRGSLAQPYLGVDRPPLLDYPHSEGAAIIGGYVYRGQEFAADLGGKYIFGDNIANVVWVLDESTTPPQRKLLCTMPRGSGPNAGNDYVGLSSFGHDHANELYMCQLSSVGGRIYKLQRGGPPAAQMPALLSETGVFKDLASLEPAEGFTPYAVNTPLWSDGADKHRWFAIPTGHTIGFKPDGEWTFPEGSVWVKHFELTIDEASQTKRRLETRLLVRDTNGYVYGASYKWRPDLSDAEIVNGAITEPIAITLKAPAGALPSGSETPTDGREVRTQPWYYPSRQDCLSCHTRAAGGVLGMKTRQINGDFHYPGAGVTDNQIRAWSHAGFFDTELDDVSIGSLAKLVPISATAASLEHRVRSYLDANCSHCHRPGGARASWDARFDTPLGLANIIAGTVLDSLGVPGAQNVAPRDPERSIMHRRISTASERYRMPPLAKNLVDPEAVALLAEWIQSLDAPPAVTIQSPASGGLHHAPALLRLAASVESSNRPIVSVQFYSGETKLGESTNSPFDLDWLAQTPGTFEIAAFATDDRGLTGRSAPVSVTVVSPETHGLLAEYFDNPNHTAPRVARIDPAIDFDWGMSSPDLSIEPDTFSVRWRGRVVPRFSQTHTFYATTDDGVRLWVNNRLIISRWNDQGPTVYAGSVFGLVAGQACDVRMEMYDNGGSSLARLEWAIAGMSRQIVPMDALLPPAPTNSAPRVAVRKPAAGTALFRPSSLEIEAEVEDAENNLSAVEFFANGVKLGRVASPPFVWTWTAPSAGRHLLTVRAFDSGGLAAHSPPSLVFVRSFTIRSHELRDGLFRFECAVAEGTQLRVESSTDLLSWNPAATQAAQNGAILFSEKAGTDGRRFYRVVPLEP